MNQATWETVRELMLPYDGGASQIHVLGIAKSEITHTLSSIEKGTTDPIVTLLANKVLDYNINLKDLHADVISFSKVTDGQTTIRTILFQTAVVTFDIWGEITSDTFDLEVWFWADQLFTDNESKNQKRFSVLLGLLDKITSNGECKCILTPSEASDPLEDLEKGYGVLLDIKSA